MRIVCTRVINDICAYDRRTHLTCSARSPCHSLSLSLSLDKYIYTYIYIYVYLCICTYVGVCIYVYTYVYIYIYIHTSEHTCLHVVISYHIILYYIIWYHAIAKARAKYHPRSTWRALCMVPWGESAETRGGRNTVESVLCWRPRTPRDSNPPPHVAACISKFEACPTQFRAKPTWGGSPNRIPPTSDGRALNRGGGAWTSHKDA